MPPELEHALFRTGGHHEQLVMRRLPDAKLLWVNQRIARHDPAFIRCGSDLGAYENHLLDHCAYEIAAGVDERSPQNVFSFADRYGGFGIGTNGGSGRSTFLNGYYVKGVGGTPLIGFDAELNHASGGAYLEECVRETIFSEITAEEFPFGAVPTLAIIDTGMVHYWPVGGDVPCERRALLIRPPFLRLAHLERAASFRSSQPGAAEADVKRTLHMQRVLLEHHGITGLRQILGRFFANWAEQLAFGFVHRLAHGGETSSNICLNGSLLDFGASSALPSWANTSLSEGGRSGFGGELEALFTCLRSTSFYLGRFGDPSFSSEDCVHEWWTNACDAYRKRLLHEFLVLVGVPDPTSDHREDDLQLFADIMSRLLTRYQRRFVNVHADLTKLEQHADIASIWDQAPPAHLTELRRYLDERLAVGERSEAEARCRWYMRPRRYHYREAIRVRLRGLLPPAELPSPDDREIVGRLIVSEVNQARRVSRVGDGRSVPFGFARSETFSLALFRAADGPPQAKLEWCSCRDLRRKFDTATMADGGMKVVISAEHDSIRLLGCEDLSIPCFVQTDEADLLAPGTCGSGTLVLREE